MAFSKRQLLLLALAASLVFLRMLRTLRVVGRRRSPYATGRAAQAPTMQATRAPAAAGHFAATRATLAPTRGPPLSTMPLHRDAPRRGLNSTWSSCKGAMKQVKYSAAYLVAAPLLRKWPPSFLDEGRLAQRGTMMEAASFLVFDGPPNAQPRTVKSLDMLAFYVEHLSWYERRIQQAAKEGTHTAEARREVEDVARAAVEARLAAHTEASACRAAAAPRGGVGPGDGRVVAVLPFYAAGQGQGPSSQQARAAYLNATLASIREHLTVHVVVAVANVGDLRTAAQHGPLFDVLYLPGLVNPNKVGAAALIAAHRALRGERPSAAWAARSDLGMAGSVRALPQAEQPEALAKHAWTAPEALWRTVDHFFYTESDQLLRLRNRQQLLDRLDADPDTVFIPHRAVPLPVAADFPDSPKSGGAEGARQQLLQSAEIRNNSAFPIVEGLIHGASCCFATAHACKRGSHGLLTPDELRFNGAPLLRIHEAPNARDPFVILAGEGNFRKKVFRPCTFGRKECVAHDRPAPG
ncbi:hypothetical protein M885DRAFT_562341 [Pelagophyceae sp. CCMP2097]|nr:hypothetical protein M885DRAFT_562341 [Pelagophyceae sp. CCMP2097]